MLILCLNVALADVAISPLLMSYYVQVPQQISNVSAADDFNFFWLMGQYVEVSFLNK